MNKVLVTLYVPRIDRKLELFIPVNRKIRNVKGLISKAVAEFSSEEYASEVKSLYNRDTGEEYKDELIIKETDIRNGTSLILI